MHVNNEKQMTSTPARTSVELSQSVIIINLARLWQKCQLTSTHMYEQNSFNGYLPGFRFYLRQLVVLWVFF